ncbi:MAG: c-type cytochrome [Ferruginibacter sp.]
MIKVQLKAGRYSRALILIIILASCNDAKKTKTITATAPVQVTSEGEELITKSNCLSCHKPAVKLIGPSFDEIAAKYPPTDENYKMLTEKIIKGGSGNWGSVPMSPHPEIAEADAKKMMNYILIRKH